MKRVVISEFMDAPAVEALAARFDVDYRPKLVDEPAALESAVALADGWIVRNRTQVRGPLLQAAQRLKVIGRLGAGLDNIDVERCQARGIRVIPASGANAESVAEYVITAALGGLRGVFFATRAVEAGTWPRHMLSQGREATGKVLGLIGLGNIGRLTARKASALGMRVIAHDPLLAPGDEAWRDVASPPRTLEQLLAESDVVSLHVPLVAETRGLLNASRLALMKPNAVLINTARGGLVDEVALATMLRQGRLGGAALDVFEQEPLPKNSHLAQVPGLLLTPHIAGVTVESNERVSAFIAQRVTEALL
ncbi:MAG: hydroxyacid dehydrogenase [Burkholderiales bacterium]|nr:hydroxyacid dehydrogenase [Burkholderiales bacterium]